jgi:hypothetical protein
MEAVNNLTVYNSRLPCTSKVSKTTTKSDSEPVQSCIHEGDMNSMINFCFKAAKQDTTLRHLTCLGV